MNIVRLTPAEGKRLREIRLRALRDAPDAFCSTYADTEKRSPEDWTQQLEELPTFVACLDGQDVGMVRGAADSERTDTRWLISMWVAPEARRQGLGEALINELIEWARSEAGVERVILEVRDDNPDAIALYERLGFPPNGVAGTLPPPREHIREHQRERRL